MKLLLTATAALVLAALPAFAQNTTTTTTVTANPDGSTTTRETTTTTTATGTIETFEPGSRFIVKETTGPMTYTYGPKVVYATRSGVVLTPEQIQTRIRVGLPVSVHYRPQGETRVIERVIIDD
ncbi:MAG TPA: hypothetical protein VD994_15345 [Prosthecobacter sp.]|nr:hypothetical protein [Prosthecobacter sp.]